MIQTHSSDAIGPDGKIDVLSFGCNFCGARAGFRCINSANAKNIPPSMSHHARKQAKALYEVGLVNLKPSDPATEVETAPESTTEQAESTPKGRPARMLKLMQDLRWELELFAREYQHLKEKGRRYDKLSLEFKGYSSDDPNV